MGMSQELWSSLEGVEESINKIVALKQVLELYPIINEEVIEVLEALILDFSSKQKEVWNQVRKICIQKDEDILMRDDCKVLAEKYNHLYNEHIALQESYNDLTKKYDDLAYYDSYKE